MTTEFSVATLWRIGRRSRNEDRFGDAVSRDGRRRVWAVADGVGGHPGGELAAETAVRASLAYVRDSESDEPIADALRHSLEAAQSAIAAAALHDRANAGMATTLALAITDGEQIGWGHVGDSRIYRVTAPLRGSPAITASPKRCVRWPGTPMTTIACPITVTSCSLRSARTNRRTR
jgi:serine/threonine protein phosphatase PrpC